MICWMPRSTVRGQSSNVHLSTDNSRINHRPGNNLVMEMATIIDIVPSRVSYVHILFLGNCCYCMLLFVIHLLLFVIHLLLFCDTPAILCDTPATLCDTNVILCDTSATLCDTPVILCDTSVIHLYYSLWYTCYLLCWPQTASTCVQTINKECR